MNKRGFAMKLLNTLGIIGVIGLIVFAGFKLFGGNNEETPQEEQQQEEQEKITEVEVMEIDSSPIEKINFEKVGVVKPNKEVTVKSQLAGYFSNIGAIEGTEVNAGDILGEIGGSLSTEINEINFKSAINNLNYAKQSLEATMNSTTQDELNAVIGAETALINYQNAINSYKNLVNTLEENEHATEIGIEAAEIGFELAENSYLTSLDNSQSSLDQTFSGVLSALTLVDNSLQVVDREDLVGEYNYMYDFYKDVLWTEDPREAKELVYQTIDLVEEIEDALHDAKTSENRSLVNALVPSLDQARSGLIQSVNAIDNIQNDVSTDSTLLALRTAETRLLTARQAMEQLNATNSSQLDSAKNGVLLAAQQLESANTLVESIKAKGKLQEIGALTQVSLSTTQYEIAELNQDFTQITAPIDGVVTVSFVDDGNYVGNGKEVVTIADMSKVKVVVNVTQEELGFVRLGQKVMLELSNGEKKNGRISRVNPAADKVSKKVDIEISVLDNTNDLISEGLATVRFTDAQKDTIATLVPFKSIIFKNGLSYVFTVENNKSVLTEVKLGQIAGNSIEIIDGLNTGDKVITNGAKLIEDGESVTITN